MPNTRFGSWPQYNGKKVVLEDDLRLQYHSFGSVSTPAPRSCDADASGEVFAGSMVAVAEGSYAGYQFIQTATASGTPGTWTQTWIVFTMGGQTYLAGNGLTLTGTTFAIDAPVSVANGGTGATTIAQARANLATLARYAADLGAITAGASLPVTHNLGTLDVHVTFRTTADNRVTIIDWTANSTNQITVNADVSFASGAVRAVVIG